MAKKSKILARLDPVETTILPIANELAEFTRIMPPDLSKWTNLHFENLYSTLDIQFVRLWLDEGGFSDAAGKFENGLNQFLVMFRHWENKLRKAGVITTERLSELQKTNEIIFREMKEELDEIYDTAEQTADWLKKLAKIITEKRKQIDVKEKPKTKNEQIALIINELENNKNVTSKEIEKATGINESRVRQLWRPIKKMNQRKKHRGYIVEGKIEAEDTSMSCHICRAPLSKPFECPLCTVVISNECKECHYTNQHPEDAIP